ncbi:MAG: hypothetical protein FH758_12280 [Firmicutes bacterium]|nr:hypothetical protein [Bacillota bacterium]
MGFIKENITKNSWFQGGSGGLLAGICCVLHAVAIAIGFSAGATFFGELMEEYRLYFLGAGMIFMMGTFFWSIKKHNISTKKAIISHLAIMLVTFTVIFSLLNIFLILVD